MLCSELNYCSRTSEISTSATRHQKKGNAQKWRRKELQENREHVNRNEIWPGRQEACSNPQWKVYWPSWKPSYVTGDILLLTHQKEVEKDKQKTKNFQV